MINKLLRKYIYNRRFPAVLTALALILSFSGCAGTGSAKVKSASEEIFAMDTIMTVTCYGDKCDEALEASKKEIKRLEELLSTEDPDSEIALINKNGEGTVSEDTAEIISRALEIYKETDGAFDISVYPVMKLWGFDSNKTDKENDEAAFHVPADAELQDTLKLVDSSQIEFDKESGYIHLAEGQGIDLGGIAKGYASGRLMEIFEEYGLDSGVVSLGGNVQCYKTKPDGSKWRCGIKNPKDPENNENLMGIIEVADKAVITSGAYERNFTDEKTGKTYHHIIDPKTGYPADSGIISATIISEDATMADALSTAVYVMGLEKAESYWQQHKDEFDMVLMTDDGEVHKFGDIELS